MKKLVSMIVAIAMCVVFWAFVVQGCAAAPPGTPSPHRIAPGLLVSRNPGVAVSDFDFSEHNTDFKALAAGKLFLNPTKGPFVWTEREFSKPNFIAGLFGFHACRTAAHELAQGNLLCVSKDFEQI